jgi:DNA-binding CsgD family transcriptional regulator
LNTIDRVRLLDAVDRLDRAATFEDAQDGLRDLAGLIDMPVLAWAPDVSRPSFNAHMDAFMLRAGWPADIVELWWDRNLMLKNPVYIRCRTRGMPFVTDMLTKLPSGRPELRRIAEALRGMGANSLITMPVHLPRSQVAMVSWGGPRSADEARALLLAIRSQLLAAAHHFLHAYISATGACRASQEELSRLTPREWECLRLTAQGCREDEAATLIGLSSTTVRYHLDNVVRKLGASNRSHAVAIAAQLGLLGAIG